MRCRLERLLLLLPTSGGEPQTEFRQREELQPGLLEGGVRGDVGKSLRQHICPEKAAGTRQPLHSVDAGGKEPLPGEAIRPGLGRCWTSWGGGGRSRSRGQGRGGRGGRGRRSRRRRGGRRRRRRERRGKRSRRRRGGKRRRRGRGGRRGRRRRGRGRGRRTRSGA